MKRIEVIVVVIIIVFCFVGCKGKIATINNDSLASIEQNSTEANTDSITANDTSSEEAIQTKINENENNSAVENLQVETYEVKMGEPYNAVDMNIEILGLETYKSLETAKYKDAAVEGQEYVVVYLNIDNRSSADEYFNYNDIETFFDGEAVSTTYLLNSPKNYASIFNVLPIDTETKGYLVYQVPNDWEELLIVYNGWEMTRGIKLEFLLEPSDKKEVKEFGSEFYAPYTNGNN